jgi:hypothetical protein
MNATFQRTLLLAALAVVLLGAVPAFAGEAPATVPAAPAPAVAAPDCAPALPVLGNFTPAEPAANADTPDWLSAHPLITLGKKFHGYCHCGCVPVPNCNTDADCGGATCGTTISCC